MWFHGVEDAKRVRAPAPHISSSLPAFSSPKSFTLTRLRRSLLTVPPSQRT
jgi:hypothetical protein